ncbi:2-oxoglutarate and iron-dependent oxygenase domain-containing protein [Moorena sp. SIOASIH]|uniref:isopenicillin N synthase family dioxygenase n=1 Tax=Moorena sp. SIOASIH TaxID=2607817 RepID=UPI0025E110AD|nr:2-oxoglutarate and iron-dependent oxygenase domain-containing protein [Moorena sp. SIOASIH]
MNLVANKCSTANASNSIPVIDFQPFLTGDYSSQKAVAAKLERAMQDVGCFYLSNTSVSLTAVAQVFTLCKYFFALPSSEKEQLLIPPDGSYHGYIVKRADGKITSEKLSITQENLQSPSVGVRDQRSQWFEEHPQFCNSLSQAYGSFQDTMDSIFLALAIALDAPENYFKDLHSQRNDSMLLHHYPPLAPTQESVPMRNTEHIDYGSLSFLFQDEVGGLEVYTQTGNWVAVQPIQNTPLIVLGNVMSRWTNDKYPGTMHRVSLATARNTTRERYSFGLFPAPDENAEITCLESCLAPNEKPKYPPILTHEYYSQGFEAKLKQQKQLD